MNKLNINNAFGYVNKKDRKSFLNIFIRNNVDIDWELLIKEFPFILKYKREGGLSIITKVKAEYINNIINWILDNKKIYILNKIINIKILEKISLEVFKKILDFGSFRLIDLTGLDEEKISLIIKKGMKLGCLRNQYYCIGYSRKVSSFMNKGGRIDISIIKNLKEISNNEYNSDLIKSIMNDNYSEEIRNQLSEDDFLELLQFIDELILSKIHNERTIEFKKYIFDLTSDSFKIKYFHWRDYCIKDFSFLEYLYKNNVEFLHKEFRINDFIKNKGLIKEFNNYFFNDKNSIIDSKLLFLIICCKKYYKDFDEQLMLIFFKDDYCGKTLKFPYFINNYFQIISAILPIKKAIKFFREIKYKEDFEDFYRMYKKVNDNMNLTIPKFKKFKDMHDYYSILVKKITQPLFELNQGLDDLDGVKLDDDFVVKIPITNHDLIFVGNNLKHCVGNGDYSLKTKDGYKFITLYKDDKLFSCVEYKGRIIQHRGFRNAEINLPQEVELKLLKLIKSCFKELPQVTFDKNASEFVLNSFNFSVNDDGFIIDPDNNLYENENGDLVHLDNFKGIQRKDDKLIIIFGDERE